VPAMRLHELGDVHSRYSQRDEHLDDELVTGWRGVGGRPQPFLELGAPRGRDPKVLLRTGGVAPVGLDERISLEPLEGRIYLADVERPDVAVSGFELVAELEPVLRPLAQQGEQGVTHAHRGPPGNRR